MADVLDLVHALLEDEIPEIERLIASGVDVNAKDYSGRRPLDCCTILEPCYEDPDDRSPGHDMRLQKARLLLEHGADPSLQDTGGWSLVHQCAYSGDLALLTLCVRKGARVGVPNNQGHLPVEQAFHRGHTPLISYLEQQSCDLRSLCRWTIREAMGKRSYHRINDLPLPPGVKLFLNYGTPYLGFSATVVPPRPWSPTDLHRGKVEVGELGQFMMDHGNERFLEEHRAVLGGTDLSKLVEAFNKMYLWESFKTCDYEEPAARPPRYPLETTEGGRGEQED